MQKEKNIMHKFNYSFIKDKTITSDLFSLSNIISDLKTKIESRKKDNEKLFSKLETIAIKESVDGSNAIEGIFTAEKRIKELVEDNSQPLTHNEEEIAGYHDAIKFIKEIHHLLVSRYIGFNKGVQFKKSYNIIAKKNADGSIKRVIFNPVSPGLINDVMRDFFLAYQVARDDYNIPSLLLIPCVIVDFLSIHPLDRKSTRLN